MDLISILQKSAWAGAFAGALGIIFTAPRRYVVPAFVCGFAGVFSRGVLTSWGLTHGWSTAVASALLVLIAAGMIRDRAAPLVVMMSGVIPLGAASSAFGSILGLMKVSSLQGEELDAAAVALTASAGKLFTTTLAMALGLLAGMAITRLLRRESVWPGNDPQGGYET